VQGDVSVSHDPGAGAAIAVLTCRSRITYICRGGRRGVVPGTCALPVQLMSYVFSRRVIAGRRHHLSRGVDPSVYI